MSTIFKFVFPSILKPVFIKFSIISFCIRSVLRLDIFLKSIHHPYTILHTLYQICLTLKIVYGCQKAHRFRHHKTAHGEVEAAFCIFFFQDSYHCMIRISYNVFVSSFSAMSLYCWANRMALSNISSDIDG